MRKLIVVAAVVVVAGLVGIFTAWQWGVGVLLLGGMVFASSHLLGFETDSYARWGRAVYGDDPKDADHWSRTGGKRKR
jgi:hypothetical protein